jgi:hypothetical protein
VGVRLGEGREHEPPALGGEEPQDGGDVDVGADRDEGFGEHDRRP